MPIALWIQPDGTRSIARITSLSQSVRRRANCRRMAESVRSQRPVRPLVVVHDDEPDEQQPGADEPALARDPEVAGQRRRRARRPPPAA